MSKRLHSGSKELGYLLRKRNNFMERMGCDKLREKIITADKTQKVINFKMLEKQIAFLQSTADTVVYMAGIGSGKTFVSCVWALIQAKKGRSVIMVEPTNAMIIRNLWKTFFESVFPALGWREGVHFTLHRTEKIMKFTGGGDIIFASAESIETIRGYNGSDALIDEFASIPTDEVYKVLIGRLRKHKDRQVRLVGTPRPLPWVKDILKRDDVTVIRQTTIENYFLPSGYINLLKTMYGEDSPFYRQEVLGEVLENIDGLIAVSKIKRIPYHAHVPNMVRAWDFAHSNKKSSDYTASVLMGKENECPIIFDVTRWQGEYGEKREQIIQTMMKDPAGTVQVIENSQGGMVIRSDLMRDSRLRNIAIKSVNPVQDKVTRSLPFASRVAQSMVTLVDGKYSKEFLEELEMFGSNKGHDDQVDACVYAYLSLDSYKPAHFVNLGIH